MYKDKDTHAMEELLKEHYIGYTLRSNKPIERIININARVRITRTVKGWDVEILDPEIKQYIPASEFISDIVLKEYTEETERFQKEHEKRETSRRMREELKTTPTREAP